MGVADQRSYAVVPKPRPFDIGSKREVYALVRDLEEAIRAEERDAALKGSTLHPCAADLRQVEGGVWQYWFAFSKSIRHVRTGCEVWLSREGEDRCGRVSAVWRTELEIELDEKLGGLPDEWVLRTPTDTLWPAVRQRLRSLWPKDGSTPTGFAPDNELLRDLLTGRSLPRGIPLTATGGAALNELQRTAISQALSRRVHYIFGPPGTGKTTTIAALCTDLVTVERSALVVTLSNKAADVAAEKIAAQLANHPRFDDGLVLRYGNGDPERLALWADRLIPSQIISRIRRELRFSPATLSQLDKRRPIARAMHTIRSAGAMDPWLRETGRRTLRRLRWSEISSNEARQRRRAGSVRLAKVVVTTMHQVVLKAELAQKYDTVIIDEASQATLPLALIAAAHADAAVIVAGDPQQLPFPTAAEDSAPRQLLRQDLFRYAKVLDRRQSSTLTQLEEQHRMKPVLSRFVSMLAYAGRLRVHPAVLQRRPARIGRDLGELLWLDTSHLAPTVRRTASSSRLNDVHADVIANAVRELETKGLLATTSLAVLTPFVAQAERLRSRLKATPCVVSSVHARQGDEADVVILDLTDAAGEPVSQFLGAESMDEDGGRLLTVAASRARECLIVVAHFSFLQRHGGAVVRRFLDELKRNGRPLTTRLPHPGRHRIMSQADRRAGAGVK